MERVIEASAMLHATTGSARTVLRSSPELVLGDPDSETRTGPRRFGTTVPAHVGSGTTVEQEVIITFGPLRSTEVDENAVGPFSWEPIGFERFMPSFCGDLAIDPVDGTNGSRLTVRGTYRAPLGRVGRFGDSVIGHRIARQSLTLYVERLAERIDREAVRCHTATPLRPAPYNEDLRPHSRSQHHVG